MTGFISWSIFFLFLWAKDMCKDTLLARNRWKGLISWKYLFCEPRYVWVYSFEPGKGGMVSFPGSIFLWAKVMNEYILLRQEKMEWIDFLEVSLLWTKHIYEYFLSIQEKSGKVWIPESCYLCEPEERRPSSSLELPSRTWSVTKLLNKKKHFA